MCRSRDSDVAILIFISLPFQIYFLLALRFYRNWPQRTVNDRCLNNPVFSFINIKHPAKTVVQTVRPSRRPESVGNKP